MTYEPQPGKTRKESRRETFLVEKASLDVHYPPEFFRDVKFPPELPVFTIKEGRLEGTFRTSKVPADAEPRLKQIIERLREEEARYNRLSVNAVELRTTNPLRGGIDKTRTTKMHSLLVDGRAYTDARHETWHFSGSFRPMLWTEGFDGQTYRVYGRHPPEQQKGGYAWVSSRNLFEEASTLVPVMLRPHSALIPGGSSYRRLTDILWPAPGTLPPQLVKSVEYLGEAQSGPFECFVLAVAPARARTAGVKSLLWLAKDRNLIPVRFEEYLGGNLPVRLEIIDKFQEPSHGVWYPTHKTRYLFRQHIPPAVREGYLFVDQCWDYSVQSVSLEPEAPFGHFQPDRGRRRDRRAILRPCGKIHRQICPDLRRRPGNAGRQIGTSQTDDRLATSREKSAPCSKLTTAPTPLDPKTYRVAEPREPSGRASIGIENRASRPEQELGVVRIVGPILGILAGIAVLGGIVWYSRYAPWVPQPPNPRIANVGLSEPVSVRMQREAEAKAKAEAEQAKAPAEREPGRPALATKAPFPKAVVGETVHDFGTLEVLQEGKHRFRVENKGEGPLSLAVALSTGLPWKREVAPGQSTEYEMTWRSFEPSANFAKTATIWTSDPKLPEVQLKVQGRDPGPPPGRAQRGLVVEDHEKGPGWQVHRDDRLGDREQLSNRLHRAVEHAGESRERAPHRGRTSPRGDEERLRPQRYGRQEHPRRRVPGGSESDHDAQRERNRRRPRDGVATPLIGTRLFYRHAHGQPSVGVFQSARFRYLSILQCHTHAPSSACARM